MALGQFVSQESVQTGLWRDHDTRSTQILMSEGKATFWTSLIAAWLALGAGYTFDLLKYLILLILRKWFHREEQERQERVHILQQGNGEGSVPVTITEVFETAPGGRDLLANIWSYSRQRHSLYRVWSIIFGLLFLAVYVGWIIAGVFVSNIQTGNVALWSSDRCGVWLFDDEHAGEEVATRAAVRDRSKESRAGEYAKACYVGEGAFDGSVARSADSCNFFYKPAIPFTNTTSYKCPFHDESLCAPGAPSISFTTGFVSASQIGINEVSPYKFRRNTTCTPLNTDDTYVRREEANGTTTFYYHYGEIADGDFSTNYTFSSAGNPFDMLAPTYNVSAYATSWYPELDYWVPIPGLRPPAGSTLTILFISALHILYLDSSADPIFPADQTYFFEGESNPWYYKSDPKSRVLACVDSHELCAPGSEGPPCWSMTDTPSGGGAGGGAPPSYWLMKLALEASNTYDAVARRLGTALIAQEVVSQSLSRALGDGHWRREAARLFATSLARIQFDALGIASGEDGGQEGYVDMTPDEAGDLCGLVRFRSGGYRNLHLGWAVVLGLLVPGLMLLGLEQVRACCVGAFLVLKGRCGEMFGRRSAAAEEE